MIWSSSKLRRASECSVVAVLMLALGLPALPGAVAEDPPTSPTKSPTKARDLVIVEPRLSRRCRALDMNDRPAALDDLEARVAAWLATCVTSRTNDARRERALVHGNRSLVEVFAALPADAQRVRIVPHYTFSGERVTRVVFSSQNVANSAASASDAKAGSGAGQAATTPPAAPAPTPSSQNPSSIVPRPEAEPVDIMLPDDGQDLILDLYELIERLREQGKSQDADKLERLTREAAKLLVSVGLLVGAYYVGTKFRAGKLLFMWGVGASGPVFQRALGRLDKLLPEVESALEAAVDAAGPHVSAAGAGLDWRVLDQMVDPSVPAQLDSAACGPACAQMLLEDRGLETPQTELIERARARLHPELKSKRVTGVTMLRVLEDLDPAGGWVGGGLTTDFLQGKAPRQLLEEFGAKGSWLAQVDNHFVVIDRFDRDTDTLLVRDPWYEPGTERGIVAGSHYRVSLKTFFAHWPAVAVYRD